MFLFRGGSCCSISTRCARIIFGKMLLSDKHAKKRHINTLSTFHLIAFLLNQYSSVLGERLG